MRTLPWLAFVSMADEACHMMCSPPRVTADYLLWAPSQDISKRPLPQRPVRLMDDEGTKSNFRVLKR